MPASITCAIYYVSLRLKGREMDPFSGRQKEPAKAIAAKAQPEAASALAIAALRFIAEEPERLRVFLSLTGKGRQSAADGALNFAALLLLCDDRRRLVVVLRYRAG